jgi:hypothetical protein
MNLKKKLFTFSALYYLPNIPRNYCARTLNHPVLCLFYLGLVYRVIYSVMSCGRDDFSACFSFPHVVSELQNPNGISLQCLNDDFLRRGFTAPEIPAVVKLQ